MVIEFTSHGVPQDTAQAPTPPRSAQNLANATAPSLSQAEARLTVPRVQRRRILALFMAASVYLNTVREDGAQPASRKKNSSVRVYRACCGIEVKLLRVGSQDSARRGVAARRSDAARPAGSMRMVEQTMGQVGTASAGRRPGRCAHQRGFSGRNRGGVREEARTGAAYRPAF